LYAARLGAARPEFGFAVDEPTELVLKLIDLFLVFAL
jgi:hypothetical protein